MLTKIDAEDLQGHTLSLPLQPSTPGYIIKEIEGLDPVKSTITSSSFAQLDGSQFQSAKRESRNIVLKIGMEPYYGGGSTVAQLRATLYAYFMPKNTVNLKFYIDDVFSYSILGQVESCESSLFTKDPEITISLICFDPNFSGPAELPVSGNSVDASTEQTIALIGNVETGYRFVMTINRVGVTGISISNRRPDASVAQMDITPSSAFLSGDIITISTEFKKKYATLTRGGVPSSILYAVSATSKWGPLWPGDNYYRVRVTGAAIPFSLYYTPKYGGL